MKKEMAQKAAKWWADKLRFGSSMDNGDDSDVGAMSMILSMANQNAERASRPKDDADKFEASLVKRLEGEDGQYFSLGVDYNPDHILSSAAEEVGVDLGMSSLPWKTNMRFDFDTDEIKVSEGYRAEEIVLV